MASTERSLGWATGVASTDGSSAYDTARMTSMEKNTLGNGILLTGSYLALSNTSSVLTLADGAAVINGYFYESNGAVTISSSGLGTTTYNILIIANTSGASLTVSANGAGTTTIANATTRAALVTAAQLSTIGSAIGGANYLLLGTINVSAGSFNNLVPAYDQTAKIRGTANTQFAQHYTSGAANIPNLTSTNFSPSTYENSADGSMRLDATGSKISVPAGHYIAHLSCQWDTNTTGSRTISISGDTSSTAINEYSISAAIFSFSGGAMSMTTSLRGTSSMDIYPIFYQNSGTTRTVSRTLLRVYRIV
jgi:hypothetical protein